MDNSELKCINVDNLIWKPGKRTEPILNQINAALRSGRFYGILGPNGAGKTSLVRQLLRLKESDSGSITFDGNDIKSIRRSDMARSVAFLPQSIKADVDFTVYDVVAMGREPHRNRFTALDEHDMKCINEAMEFTNCTALRDKSISLLSGGERQRVMIARTIAQDTPWIILDEPVSNLDIKHQTELMHVLDRLRQDKGKTVVAILHDINLAATFCTHIILMKDGAVYKDGTTAEVLTKENLKAVYEMDFDFIRGRDRKISYIAPRFEESIARNLAVGDERAESADDGGTMKEVLSRVKTRWDSIAKPIDSLGLLEESVVRICCISGSEQPCDISRRALVIMCADHGVTAEGVTQTDSSVTRIVSENFARGCSTVNYMAGKAGVDVYTIDIGMNTPNYPEKNLVQNAVIDRKVAMGTKNLCREAAMTVEQCRQAIDTGIKLVGELKDKGYTIIATGEMGIGNTTPTSALAAVFLGLSAEEVTGKGAGISSAGLERKMQVVNSAISRVRSKHMDNPVDILAEVGGYELAGMAGIYLGGVKYGIPIVMDGAISTISALCAMRIDERVRDYVIASHESEEITGRLALEELDVHAPVHAGMCLGEGTGAMTVFPILDMAMEVYAKMGSFQDYDIEAYERYQL